MTCGRFLSVDAFLRGISYFSTFNSGMHTCISFNRMIVFILPDFNHMTIR